MDIITVKPGFQCYLNQREKLICGSDKSGTSSFTLDGSVRLNNWYILILRSNQSNTDIRLYQLSMNVFSQDSVKRFFPFGYDSLSFDSITMGIETDGKSDGFLGSIRNLKLFSDYQQDSVLLAPQFIYIYPFSKLLIQVVLNDAKDLSNDADRAVAYPFGKERYLTTEIDFTGNYWCWFPTEVINQFADFTKKPEIQSYDFSSTSFNTNTNFETTLQVWFKRSNTVNVDSSSQSNEVLFEHRNFIKVSFNLNDYTRIRIDPLNFTDRTALAPVGLNRWYFLQVITQSTQFLVQLFEADGTQVPITTPVYPRQQRATTRTVLIGSNFNGYINGLKYYKSASPPRQGIYEMSDLIDQSQDCLMYFLFKQQGMSDSKIFTNFAWNSRQNTLAARNSVSFSPQFYRDYQSADKSGTIESPLNFDGYTCVDNKEKVYLIDESSYIQSNIAINETLKSYTFEFWVKTASSIIGEAFFLAIYDTNDKKIYTSILQQSDKSLYCYALYSETSDSNRVAYLDYQSDNQRWQHISCIVDAPNSLVKSTIFYNNLDFVYYNSIDSSIALPKRDLQLFLNAKPGAFSKGIDGVYYQELRFWSYTRTIRQIQEGRYIQLDPKIEQPYMYTYAKLMNAKALNNEGELDYSDYNLQRTLTLNNVKWQAASDLIVCPQNMFKGGFQENICYREGIIQLQAVPFRNATHYFISSFFSIFRNNYLRDNAETIYQYKWTLTKIDSANSTNTKVFPQYFEAQSANQILVFSQDQVSNLPGTYDVQLEVIDKNQHQDLYKTTARLRTYSCASIFDFETKESLIYKDMDSQRAVDDAVFYYDFTECDDYRFDQDSMSFTIDVNDKFAFQSRDHNKEAKSFTIRAQLQSNLLLNDYFYLRITGVWKNTTNPRITIEYNMVYACRYISKLVPKLFPNLFTVLQGQNLVINYEAKYYNLKDAVSDRNFTVQWECPGRLNQYCSQQSNSLRLTYDLFLNSGLEFWKPQSIRLKAQTNFIQGDGSKESIAAVDITWLNVNPHAKLYQASQILSKEQSTTFQLDMSNLVDSQVQIQWLTKPQISRDCYINSNNRQQFVLNSTCLTEGTKYDVTSNILHSQRASIIWNSTVSFTMPVSPSRGRISCSRTSGRAFIDEFRCSASAWSIPNSPARYQFYVTDIEQNILIPVSALTTTSDFSSSLPPTRKMVLKVVDNSQGIGYAELAINVAYTPDDLVTKKVQSLIDEAQSQVTVFSSNTMINNLQIASQALKNLEKQSNLSFNLKDMHLNMTQMIYNTSKNLNRFSEENRRSFLQSSISIFSSLTKNSSQFNLTTANLILEIVNLLVSDKAKSSIDYLVNVKDFQAQFFSVQENILQSLLKLQQQGNITTALMDQPPIQNPQLSNISIQVREILGNYEAYLSTKIYEGQTFFYNNSAFNFQIKKFSRIGKTQIDQEERFDDWSFTSYYYPLEQALQPTARQSFTVINFAINPFIGDYYLNQSSTSKTGIYFSYRDDFGTYLSGDKVINDIQIKYKYDYSPFVFLPNVTTCGYIGLQDPHWENSSCSVEFHRRWGEIICNCKHMSYYSIIDDYLVRPQKVPLIYLSFRNWSSFIVFLYVILVFVIGTIYTYNKDNQDFRYLHDQEEQAGNVMESEDSLTVVSLAFKRKVFFMMFAEKYKFSNLFKIYIMLLHPLFQLKYRLDPETPRFYRFLLLFSRMVLLFGLTFWLMRDVKNLEDLKNDPSFGMTVFNVVLFIVLGSILLVPVPILLLCCCRSRYYLIDPKGSSRQGSENEDFDDPNGIGEGREGSNFRDRITEIMIDTNIPIKLLFLINAHKIETIMKEYQGRLRYASGELTEVGKKLQELDGSVKVAEAKNHPTKDDSNDQDKKVPEEKENDDFQEDSHTVQNLKSARSNHPLNASFSTHKKLKASEMSTIIHKPERSSVIENSNFQKGRLQIRDRFAQGSQDSSNNNNFTEQEILENMEAQRTQNQNFDNENLDDDEFGEDERQRQRYMNEGGEREMQFDSNNNNQNANKEREDDAASELESIDTQLFTDEKKELIQEPNRFGRIAGNILALCFNLGIIVSVFAIYISEGYYDLTNQYVWVIVFFGAQIFSVFVTDMAALFIVALCVTKCCVRRKTCLARWMRESLYIYEDYKYVVQFANTKIS